MWQLQVRDASEEGQNNSELIVKKVGDNLTLTCTVGDGLELTDSSLSFFWTLPVSNTNRYYYTHEVIYLFIKLNNVCNCVRVERGRKRQTMAKFGCTFRIFFRQMPDATFALMVFILRELMLL